MKTIIFSTIISAALSITGIHTASANHSANTQSNASFNDRKTGRVVSGEPNFKGSENFAKSFPAAMVKSYETVEGRTKVTFTWNGDALEAFYDLDGNLMATSHFISTTNLPLSVQMKVRDGYQDYSIQQAVEFYSTEKGLSYFLMLKKESKGIIVQVNSDGGVTFVKKVKDETKGAVVKVDSEGGTTSVTSANK